MSVPKIELRTGEPGPRTIYRDLVNLPDPVKLGLTVRYFNYDDVGLYFQITGSGPGYTFETANLGLLASGSNTYRNLDEFASRAKPATESSEIITLTLKAYTDSGYTDLKWTYDRSVSVVWIKSDDPSYTVDYLNNFDDGTVQGWAVADEANNHTGFPKIDVVTDYVLSAPYSCKMTQEGPLSIDLDFEVRGRLYKSFTTPDKNIIYAIIDIRIGIEYDPLHARPYIINQQFQRNTTVLVFLGKPYTAQNLNKIPVDKWLRIVIPLPKATTVEIRLVSDFCNYHGTVYVNLSDVTHGFTWIDDFKIISKWQFI